MEKNKCEVGVKITLKEPDDFLKIKETLTRIGIASKTSKTLYQSCHILHKQGNYYIVHFLELFFLDGKAANISDDDFRRRNTIASLLNKWGLCDIENMSDIDLTVPTAEIKIVPFKEKKDWSLIAKYTLGTKKNL